jgi:hypothetical protein
MSPTLEISVRSRLLYAVTNIFSLLDVIANAIVGTMVYNTKGLRTPMSVKWFDYINANGTHIPLTTLIATYASFRQIPAAPVHCAARGSSQRSTAPFASKR